MSGSAVGYYGDRGDEVLTEGSAAGAGFLAGVCVAWEAAAAPAVEAGNPDGAAADRHRAQRVRRRVGQAAPTVQTRGGGKLGSGRQYRSWITLHDEVAAILRCVDDSSLSGPVNATAPHPVTDAELARALGAALHRPAFLAVPAPALKLALGPEMAADMVLASQRVLPRTVGAIRVLVPPCRSRRSGARRRGPISDPRVDSLAVTVPG